MDSDRSAKGRHPIRVVTRRTGLSAAALRAWERRYEAVVPKRSSGGQRLYSDEDLHRLALLKAVVDAGRNIGHVAPLDTTELERLVREDLDAGGADGGGGEDLSPRGPLRSPTGFVKAASQAVDRLDPRELEAVLTRAAMSLTPVVLVEEVMVPLLRRIGLMWSRGEAGPATEHVASTAIRRFLDWTIMANGGEQEGGVLVVGTPPGQAHEFGALLAGVVAASEGWRVTVVGADLPGIEIADVARRKGAAAVALSALLPGSPERLLEAVAELQRGLPEGVRIFIGGPAAEEARDGLGELGVEHFSDLNGFRAAVASGGDRTVGKNGQRRPGGLEGRG